MLRNSARICLVAAVAAFLVVAGCSSKQAAETTPSAQSKIGLIVMDKAIKSHPKYADVQRLQKEYAALAARIDAEKAQSITGAEPPAAGSASGLEQAADKEFAARMAAKESEVKTRFKEAAEQAHRDMTAELDAYAREVDKEYQPQLFSLQLKLKTVQLSKEEAAALQAEVDKLQQERAAKITARQQALSGEADAMMKAKQGEADKELAAYAQTLNGELAGKLASQQAEVTGRIAPPGTTGGGTEAAEKLTAIGRDISALQDSIIGDIRDKAAKVAIQAGLDTVLTEVKVNINATDITDAVIAEFKK